MDDVRQAATGPRRMLRTKRPVRASIEAADVAKALGGERMAAVPRSGGPATFVAVRQELLQRLRSSGGRPGLADVDRKVKVSMDDETWSKLERLASKLSAPGFHPAPAQVASALLKRAVEQIDSESGNEMRTLLARSGK